jgi:hypothetical protein
VEEHLAIWILPPRPGSRHVKRGPPPAWISPRRAASSWEAADGGGGGAVVEGGGGARKPPAAPWIRRHVKRAPPPAWISPDLDRRRRGRAASVACSFDSLCSPAIGRAEARHGCGDRGRRGRARAVAEGSCSGGDRGGGGGLCEWRSLCHCASGGGGCCVKEREGKIPQECTCPGGCILQQFLRQPLQPFQ